MYAQAAFFQRKIIFDEKIKNSDKKYFAKAPTRMLLLKAPLFGKSCRGALTSHPL
jgi:hypothetical protein